MTMTLRLTGLAACVAMSLGTPPSGRVHRRAPTRVSADSMLATIRVLAADSLGGRNAGYPGEAAAARFLARRFEALGLEPPSADGGYLTSFRFDPRAPTVPWERRTSQNVVAVLPGSDPAVGDQIVVLGAHYDGQGRAGQADPGRLTDAGGDPDPVWNSADDNASGAAAVLEIARVFQAMKLPHRRTIAFVGFGAEEPGLNGSIAYVNHPPLPWRRHVAMINIEKIGREPSLPLVQVSAATGTTWKSLLERVSTDSTRVESFLDDLIYDTDHYPFAARGVPAVVFAVVHETDTHRASDEADRIEAAALARRADYILAYLVEVVNGDRVPGWVDQNGRDPGAQVGPATGPELIARGLEPDVPALKVLDVIEGLPAARAGLRPGDLIVRVADGRKPVPEPGKNPLRDLALAVRGDLSLDVVRPGGRARLLLRLPKAVE